MDTGVIGVYVDALDQWLQVGIASGRVINISFSDTQPPDATDKHPLADRILAYFEGEIADSFSDVETALTVGTPDRRVYETLRMVDYGDEITVEHLAIKALPGEDDPESRVRGALETNPIPIIIPDHRVRDCQGVVPTAVRNYLRTLEDLE